MHDTTASEGGHRLYVKKAINRVRKGTDYDTSRSLVPHVWNNHHMWTSYVNIICEHHMWTSYVNITCEHHMRTSYVNTPSRSCVNWVVRSRTWAKVIDDVYGPSPPKRRRTERQSLTVLVNSYKMLAPTDHFTVNTGQFTFSPLRTGGDRLLCNDARLSYHELGELVYSFTGWEDYNDTVQVQLYCSAERCGPGKERRKYWATEHQYPYGTGSRRDVVHIDLGQGRGRPRKIGCAQITAFIKMYGGVDRVSEGVIIRWMDKSSLSTDTDHRDRPICDYPLSFNHCLWEWSKTDVNRRCFRTRGFGNTVTRDHLWSHVNEQHRPDVIRSEIRARYDIIGYDSIMGHVVIHEDPSTGHMLQTLQIV